MNKRSDCEWSDLFFMTRQEAIDKAQALFNEGYACSQSMLLAFANQFSLDEEAAKLISSTFGGGMGRLREKCGAWTGTFMVLGLAYGNKDPGDMETKLAAYEKVQDFNRQMLELYGTTSCHEILEKYASEEDVAARNHHKIICSRVIGDAAGLLYDMLKKRSP
jgi:C_GCAxxG_C_C family probable redox protein